jgi:spore coat protein U-like protein
MRQLVKSLLLAGAAVAVLAFATPASAQSFQVTASVAARCQFTLADDIAFGDYNTLTGTAVTNDISAIHFRCSKGTNFTIDLGNGDNADGTLRGMLNQDVGTDVLTYQIYRDSGHGQVWGSGLASGAVLGGGPSPSNAAQTVTMYAQIQADQDVANGSYLDTVTVTLLPLP